MSSGSAIRRGKVYRADKAAEQLLTPFNHAEGKDERYYQQIAINRTVEAITQGRQPPPAHHGDRNRQDVCRFPDLLEAVVRPAGIALASTAARASSTLPTATSSLTSRRTGSSPPFGDARYKIESGEVVQSREMYFAIYQALAEDERRLGLFKFYAPDFFDLVIVDECHRGSARDDSSWRVILDYFKPAYQLGMTATPLRDDNRDTYLYFGNPDLRIQPAAGHRRRLPRALPRPPRHHAVGRGRLAAEPERARPLWATDSRRRVPDERL